MRIKFVCLFTSTTLEKDSVGETLGCTFGLARIFKVEYFALNFGVLKALLCEQLRRLDFRIQAQSRLLAKPGSSFLCRSFFFIVFYTYMFSFLSHSVVRVVVPVQWQIRFADILLF